MDGDVRQAYTCCDVTASARLDDPCWVCQQTGHSLNLEEPENRYTPWTKPWHLPPQNTDNSYL